MTLKRKKRYSVRPTMPQAYVMPERVEPTDDQIDAMSDAELAKYYDSAFVQVADDGLNNGYSALDDELLDFYESDFTTDIEKAAAPIIERALYADARANTAHNGRSADVELPQLEIDQAGEAIKLLIFAVWNALRSWKKQPKPEVIAQAVGVAIARARGEKGIKHPRDFAKEVRVRPQTLFKILNIATAEIQRLGLHDDLQKNGNLY